MIVPYSIIEREPGEDSYKATDFPCPEVFISVEFIKIIAIDFVVNLVKHPIKFALFWLFFECKDLCTNKLDKNQKGGSNSKKAELDIAEVRENIYQSKLSILVCCWYTLYSDCALADTSILSHVCVGSPHYFVHHVPLYSYCCQAFLQTIDRRRSTIE